MLVSKKSPAGSTQTQMLPFFLSLLFILVSAYSLDRSQCSLAASENRILIFKIFGKFTLVILKALLHYALFHWRFFVFFLYFFFIKREKNHNTLYVR